MNSYWDLFWATGMPQAWTMSRRAAERSETDTALGPPAAPDMEMRTTLTPEDRAGWSAPDNGASLN